MVNVPEKGGRENQNTHFMSDNFFFENSAVYRIMWKYIVEPERPQIKIKHGACSSHGVYLRLQAHTQNIQHLLLFHHNYGHTKALHCD